MYRKRDRGFAFYPFFWNPWSLWCCAKSRLVKISFLIHTYNLVVVVLWDLHCLEYAILKGPPEGRQADSKQLFLSGHPGHYWTVPMVARCCKVGDAEARPWNLEGKLGVLNCPKGNSHQWLWRREKLLQVLEKPLGRQSGIGPRSQSWPNVLHQNLQTVTLSRK